MVGLIPRDGERGWIANLRSGEKEKSQRAYDRIVLATGVGTCHTHTDGQGLGKPHVPALLSSAPLKVFHTASLAHPENMNRLLATIPASAALPAVDGDSETVLVVGGGKSAMDVAALLANRGRKVVLAYRGEMKWFSPAVPPGMIGTG